MSKWARFVDNAGKPFFVLRKAVVDVHVARTGPWTEVRYAVGRELCDRAVMGTPEDVLREIEGMYLGGGEFDDMFNGAK